MPSVMPKYEVSHTPPPGSGAIRTFPNVGNVIEIAPYVSLYKNEIGIREAAKQRAAIPQSITERLYNAAPGHYGKVNMPPVAPAKAASLTALGSVILAAIGITGQIIFGGLVFGMITAFALAVLAAIVLSHGG